ncbi:hypothetical protein DFH28DRAFT_1084409 [Melampsora americana]|nr:hypothetical protein DFH28DRAFT_1084409 [Melampsora americana]
MNMLLSSMLIIWKIFSIWCLPMDNFEEFLGLGNMQKIFQTDHKDFDSSTRPISVLQHTDWDYLDKIEAMSSQDWNLENTQTHHTSSIITSMKDLRRPTTKGFHQSGINFFQIRYLVCEFQKDLNHNNPTWQPLEDYFPKALNPINENSSLNNVVQTPFSDTEWLDYLLESPNNPMISDIVLADSDFELTKRHLPSLNSSSFTLEPEKVNWSEITFPQSSNNLIHECSSDSRPKNHPSIPIFTVPRATQVSDHENLMGVSLGQHEYPHCDDTEKDHNSLNVPFLDSQSTALNHIAEDAFISSKSQTHPVGDDNNPGKQPTTSSIWTDGTQHAQNSTGAGAEIALMSPDLNGVEPLPMSNHSPNQAVTSTFDCQNSSIENKVTKKMSLSKLIFSIVHFGESDNFWDFTHSEKLLLTEPVQEIRQNPDKQELWDMISQAHKILTIPFVNLLLILHPEASTQEISKDQLVQDGLDFLSGIISQWCASEVKNCFEAWRMPPYSRFDVSEPSSLLQYASNLVRPTTLSLTSLWKIWKRWFRSSTYPHKITIVGIKQFSSLLRFNIIKLKPTTGSKEIHMVTSNPLQSKLLNKNIPDQVQVSGKLKWRDFYHSTMLIGKYQYEMLTLCIEADKYFDYLQESLNQKCLGEGQGDPIFIKRIDLFIRKIYNELITCFFGGLLMINSKHPIHPSIEDLIENGWKFIKNFLDLIQSSFEEFDPMTQSAVSNTLSFFERNNYTGPFSLGTVLSILMAWFNQSDLSEKKIIKNPNEILKLIKSFYGQNEFPILEIE